jgi:hypothetical protein
VWREGLTNYNKTYPVVPVVPLFVEHPEFLKVTIENSENTERKI